MLVLRRHRQHILRHTEKQPPKTLTNDTEKSMPVSVLIVHKGLLLLLKLVLFLVRVSHLVADKYLLRIAYCAGFYVENDASDFFPFCPFSSLFFSPTFAPSLPHWRLIVVWHREENHWIQFRNCPPRDGEYLKSTGLDYFPET